MGNTEVFPSEVRPPASHDGDGPSFKSKKDSASFLREKRHLGVEIFQKEARVEAFLYADRPIDCGRAHLGGIRIVLGIRFVLGIAVDDDAFAVLGGSVELHRNVLSVRGLLSRIACYINL
jgi:hypothetical protein